MVLKSTYRGFVAPVFTPFNAAGEVNLSEVPKYAQYLHSKHVNAILDVNPRHKCPVAFRTPLFGSVASEGGREEVVELRPIELCPINQLNGTVGEGGLMSNCERKKLTEAWIDATKDTTQLVMVHVGGTNLNNVIQLAKHAEAVGAWSILCLPDLYFRPKTIDELIDYLKLVGAAAPKTPLFYYHYPQLTGVTLDMAKFLDRAYSEIPTISGLKYTHNNLDEGLRCVQLRDRTFAIFLGCDQLLSAALCMGFDCMILTILNFAAEEAHSMKDNVHSGDIQKAQQIQNRIRYLTEYVESEMEWINGFKAIITMVTNLNLGAPRPPLKTITSSQFSELKNFLKHPRSNWL